MNYRNLQSHSQGRAALHALSNSEIMKLAPSVFAEEKHSSRSERYSYVPSSQIVVALREEGFIPYYATQSRSRIEGKSEFTKHMLRFRHETQLAAAKKGNEINEVIMVNRHDGTSKIEIFGGVYRFVCDNGLMTGDTSERVAFPHAGTSLSDVIEGTYSVLDNFEQTENMMELMKGIRLEPEEQQALALQSMSLKFDLQKDFRPSTIEVIRPRRQEDREATLWNTFNVIQENLIRGGIPKTVNPPEAGKRGTTRATNNIADTVRMNKGFWNFAEALTLTKQGLI